MSDALLELTDRGLHCRAGGFWIDPWGPVDRAVVTHAHGDHARPGSAAYLGAERGREVLRLRLGEDAAIETAPWGEPVRVGDATVSFHPAGHVLGSAQVRVEVAGEVWVVTGDYKRRPDPTCEPFEPVRCHVLVTESTFGLPVYRWPDPADEVAEIHRWWAENRSEGRTSLLYGYTLGKAQRLLALLDPSEGPLLVHGAVERVNEAYRRAGVALPPVRHATAATARETRGRALVVTPPSAGGSPWARKFGDASSAFASGWMRLRGTRRRRAADRGFVLSDHVDWPALLRTVDESGAERVAVTHGYTEPVVRYLRERGLDAWSIPTRFEGEEAADAALDETPDGPEQDAGDDGDDGGRDADDDGGGAPG